MKQNLGVNKVKIKKKCETVLSNFIHIFPSPYSIEERRKWARNDTKYPIGNVVFLCLRTSNFRFRPPPPTWGRCPMAPDGGGPPDPLLLFIKTLLLQILLKALVNIIVLVNVCQHYIHDTMKIKVLVLLNCESSKYIAKLCSLSI